MSYAASLLVHVNVLLASFSGVALVTGARLQWDPTLYVALRAAAPAEYAALLLLLPLAGGALLALAMLAPAAAGQNGARRPLLMLYSGLMSALLAAELIGSLVAWRRIQALTSSPAAQELAAALPGLRDHVAGLLVALNAWHPLPGRINELIEEAESALKGAARAAMAAGVVLVLLQVLAVTLALIAVRTKGVQSEEELVPLQTKTRPAR